MAKLNDLLVLGNSNILGSLNVFGEITAPTFVGNASTANKWKNTINIKIKDTATSTALSGVSMDGSQNIELTIPNALDGFNCLETNSLKIIGNENYKHLYLTGISSTSTENKTQIVFGDDITQHLALSSNDKAFIINPTSTTITNQIALYLNDGSGSNPFSKIPSGIETSRIKASGSITSSDFFHVNVAASKNANLRLQSGTHYWDISTNSTNDTGFLNFAPNGGAYKLYLNKDGDIVTGGTFISIGEKVSLKYTSSTESLDFIFT